MPPRHTIHNTRAGFTLVEMSIVLVVIGLIIGAIFVGKDLIQSAEVRATLSQVGKYNAAVNTFRIKFNALPGDITSDQATAFGLFSVTTYAGQLGQQDGNGLIEGDPRWNGAANDAVGEPLVFWRHLSDANLIDGQFGSSGNSAIDPGVGKVSAQVTNVSQSLPPTKLTPTQYFIVFADSGFNYFQILPVTFINRWPPPFYNMSASGMTPRQAYSIDIKLDDGWPNTGTVVAMGLGAVDSAPSVNATSTNNTCTIGSGAANDTYNLVGSTGGQDPSCSIRLRFN
jgi:prepilin-type N-terminal cleavage/methylation domain-containing protein